MQVDVNAVGKPMHGYISSYDKDSLNSGITLNRIQLEVCVSCFIFYIFLEHIVKIYINITIY